VRACVRAVLLELCVRAIYAREREGEKAGRGEDRG
jgi:hypothetical protein